MNDSIYREEILDHYQHPRNSGKPVAYTNSCAKDNPFCGDSIKIYVTIKKGIVEDIHFIAQGCAISVASASLLSEYIKGWPVEKIARLGTKDMLEILKIELTPTRLKCALLSLEAVQKLLSGL